MGLTEMCSLLTMFMDLGRTKAEREQNKRKQYNPWTICKTLQGLIPKLEYLDKRTIKYGLKNLE